MAGLSKLFFSVKISLFVFSIKKTIICLVLKWKYFRHFQINLTWEIQSACFLILLSDLDNLYCKYWCYCPKLSYFIYINCKIHATVKFENLDVIYTSCNILHGYAQRIYTNRPISYIYYEIWFAFPTMNVKVKLSHIGPKGAQGVLGR